MKVYYTNRAARQFKKLSGEVQKRIAEKMRFYVNKNNPLSYAKHLTDYREGEYRFRIGDYRIVFDVEEDSIYVLDIRKRDDSY